ncbi:MAG TPA: hypothetical protein VGI45_27500 [Terracidiphilus sp.]|jgi:hypothetical protein
MNPCLRLPHACFVSIAIASFCIGTVIPARAQSKPASPPSDSSGGKPGFAIESEMMTYTAMDAEGQALACGVARNVGATDDKCTPRGTSGPAEGVVIVASPSSALAEFQLWRADISNMEMLTFRASHFCAKAPDRGASASSSSSSIGSTIMSLFPGGQALSFAQTLLSRTSESAPLEGSILDQTLVNDVAGHLRALGVSVVIPDTYMPGSLMALDERHSPYMTKLLALMKARDCLGLVAKEKPPNEHPEAGGEAKQSGEPDAAEKEGIADAIDGFLRLVNQGQVAAPPPATTSAQTSAPASAQPTISHLSAVLRADGLAQELGAASGGARSGEGGTWYLLSLKALESGGTVHKTGNAILGSKTTYAGGAVGTYALFRLTGSIVCSGVFYNYVPPMQDTKIPNMLENGQAAQPGRLVGGCAASQ